MRRRACRRARRHPVLIAVIALVLAIVFWHVLGVLLLLAAVAGGGYWAGGRNRPVRARINPGSQVPELAAELDQARADAREADARTEQYAAELSRVRQQVDELETAANRSISEITASYQAAQRQYGPAATGRRS